jgi:hypothetical protein
MKIDSKVCFPRGSNEQYLKSDRVENLFFYFFIVHRDCLGRSCLGANCPGMNCPRAVETLKHKKTLSMMLSASARHF